MLVLVLGGRRGAEEGSKSIVIVTLFSILNRVASTGAFKLRAVVCCLSDCALHAGGKIPL